jgi:prolyl-tRNA editing enzyme YbaK/EbsC (Cys-tRNA(Pro) deacylase)
MLPARYQSCNVDTMQELSKSAKRFKHALADLGHDIEIVSLSSSTRTAAEAADTIGCCVAQIAKSIVFREASGDGAIVVIASGTNRVDVRKIEALSGSDLGIADGKYVKKSTGYAIGGVPPAGHKTTVPMYLDQDLRQYNEIWAAAGTPFAVFRLSPAELANITGAEWHDVAIREGDGHADN